ncbi:MerR family transcriptional regulator [Thermobifida halotolerans]|uniref:MerR family transcriptional regulator n=1 Tax=Thermobifida halotolerans TaxID=483545 RepID=A0A399G6U5_9ACTN|nr:MerR family transcriptional regulator [Thermobifida halotolerans]UOE20781.1 MerR family transcriptional regulator [Thermobifida halotolerans]
MLIGELSARTGVSRRMLRYYEEQGLLRSRRGANGYRVYDDDAVRVVGHVRALLAAGMSTEVIATVLPCADGEPTRLDLCPSVTRALRRRLAEVDARIEDLRRSRDMLAGYLADA